MAEHCAGIRGLKKKQVAKKAASRPAAVKAAAAKQSDSAVGTLERGLAILQYFKRIPEASVADVAASLELSRSTTYRIAERLRELGFLEINTSNSLWRLGRETAQLGVAALQSTDIMRIAPPVLLDLLEGTREAVNLAVFDSDSMVLIFREQGPQSVTISSRLGSRRPMHASSLGKAYMAALKAEDRHALIERLDMKRYTPETIVDTDALKRSLISIQKRGFADDRREFEQTLACCAAAIFDHRAVPVAAISVSGPAERILAKFDRIGAEVVLAARAISARLGYLESDTP
jgi:IclR family transcriptional regulator, acetate operon repressor